MAQTKYDRALKHSTQNDTLYISIAPEKNNDTCSKSNNNFGHKNQPNFLVIILLHYKCGTTFMHTRALGEHRTLKRIVGSHVTNGFSCDKIWRTILGAQHKMELIIGSHVDYQVYFHPISIIENKICWKYFHENSWFPRKKNHNERENLCNIWLRSADIVHKTTTNVLHIWWHHALCRSEIFR